MTCLQGGTVVNVEGERAADILITDGVISAVQKGLEVHFQTGKQQRQRSSARHDDEVGFWLLLYVA